MREIDNNALRAKHDKFHIESFIKDHELFILKTAHKVTKKYITKSDDQWSVSLNAFNEAICSYSYEKGSFLSFSELVIKRRLYDYIKKQSKHFCEVAISPFIFESYDEEEDLSLKQELMNKIATKDNGDAKLEIEAITSVLNEYGFSFYDLISVSPKATKTKKSCAAAIAFLTKNDMLIKEMRKSKNLPIKFLENNLKIPRKILERHRKYIIAGTEIISGQYPIISGYLSFVKEEL